MLKGTQTHLLPFVVCCMHVTVNSDSHVHRHTQVEGTHGRLGCYFHAFSSCSELKVYLLLVFDPAEMLYICQMRSNPTGTLLPQYYRHDVTLSLSLSLSLMHRCPLLSLSLPLWPFSFTSLHHSFVLPAFLLLHLLLLLWRHSGCVVDVVFWRLMLFHNRNQQTTGFECFSHLWHIFLIWCCTCHF